MWGPGPRAWSQSKLHRGEKVFAREPPSLFDFSLRVEMVDHVMETEDIISLSTEIIESVKQVHPSHLTPRLSSFDNISESPGNAQTSRYNALFPLSFDDGTEWVIKFPLFSSVSSALVSRKVESEVATTKWVKSNTSIPVPSIHAFDVDGRAAWNSTRRPCIVMDKIRGTS